MFLISVGEVKVFPPRPPEAFPNMAMILSGGGIDESEVCSLFARIVNKVSDVENIPYQPSPAAVGAPLIYVSMNERKIPLSPELLFDADFKINTENAIVINEVSIHAVPVLLRKRPSPSAISMIMKYTKKIIRMDSIPGTVKPVISSRAGTACERSLHISWFEK